MTKQSVRLVRLHEVQTQLEELRAERDKLIKELRDEIGVRELSRFLGMSAAQISRIGRGIKQ